MTKTFEEVPVATVEVIPTFDGNEIKFKPLSKLENYLITEGEVELYLRTQHQPLPVVPEFVAVQIERVKNSNGNFATLGLFDWNHEAKPDYTKWIHENVFDFMRACTIGYTVEKPQLFYLKNKIELEDVGSDLIGYLNLFLTNGGYLTNNINRAKKFTQQEIDSMQTGSYEQIEVTE